VFCISCDGDSAEPTLSDSRTIRIAVADVYGVESIVPRHDAAGSPAHLFELLFQPASEHLALVGREGPTVELERLDVSPYSGEELAAALRYQGLRRTEVDGERVLVHFDSGSSAAQFSVETAGIASGPYRAREVGGRVRLEPRTAEAGGTTLELVSADRNDHWRLLSGRHVDVAPRIRARHASFLNGVPSLDLTAYPVRAQVAMLLNPRSPVLASSSTRKLIASTIDASALSRVVCGDCAVDYETSAPFQSVEFPRELELLVLAGSKDEALAAKVVAHQIWEAHKSRVVINHFDVDEMSRRLLSSRYQLLFMPIASDPERMFEKVLRVIEHSAEDFDTAVARGDWDAALQELIDEAVLVPLWNQRTYAAVDSSICGAKPDSAISWLWLADLYPCDEGAL
jgi:hypothetical protein